LYGEFITEASRLTVEALAHSLEQPEMLVKLYGVLGRIRLVAGGTVLSSAGACCRPVFDLFSKPKLTAGQIRAAFEHRQIDPIKEFSTVCRTELLDIARDA